MNEHVRYSAARRIGGACMTTALLLSGTAAAAPANWEGIYVGGQAAYNEGESLDRSNANATRKNLYGATGGLQAGHHWQFDNHVVLGLEGSVSSGGIERSWKDRDNNQYSPYYGKDEIERSFRLDARLGYAAGQWLPYFAAGVTAARQSYLLGCDKSLVDQTTGCRVAEYEARSSKTTSAPHVGAGVLYRFSDRLSGGVEYLYTDLGSNAVTLDDPNYPAAARRNFQTDYSSVTLKLNYHF